MTIGEPEFTTLDLAKHILGKKGITSGNFTRHKPTKEDEKTLLYPPLRKGGTGGGKFLSR